MCCACASSEPIFNAASWMKSKLFSERFVWIPPSFCKFPFFPQPLSWPVAGLRDHKLPNKAPSYSVHICPAENAIESDQTVRSDLSAVSIYRGRPYKLEPSLSICCKVVSSGGWGEGRTLIKMLKVYSAIMIRWYVCMLLWLSSFRGRTKTKAAGGEW